MKTKHMLLVEDSADDEELVGLALGQTGIAIDVSVARDGEEALRVLSGNHPPGGFSLILLDLKIPKVDGFEVLRHIRAEEPTRRVPVVVFSSSDVREDVERAYQLGANSYVCKPVDFETHSDVVQQIGRFWLGLNRRP